MNKILELQKFLFENSPSRLDLLQYVPQKHNTSYKIMVYRNHSFELVEHTIGAYLDYAEISIEFVYSDYDDSLSFINLDSRVDAIILWLDIGRYKTSGCQTFIEERLAYLKSIYSGAILLVPFECNFTFSKKDEQITVFDLNPIKEKLGSKYIDERMEKMSGTRMSAQACLAMSKQLGLRYLPALLKTALKAVVVDFDNTLYSGVLGEDGIDGVRLAQGHKLLQEKLKQLSRQGVFLCAVSKNEIEDVQRLLKERSDFPLSENDFTKIYASWDSKSESISKLTAFLNINTDSMVFIDDNIGELAEVFNVFPNIKIIHALENAETTVEVLNNFPGLLRLGMKKEDSLRKSDVQANQERERIKNELSLEDYIKSLNMHLSFDCDNIEKAERIAELANKTNQFIFSYKRYTLSEIKARINDSSCKVVNFSLSDRLTDSGLIGVCIGKKEGDYVLLEECFVSCRALGRGIDDIMVLGAIKIILESLNCSKLKVLFKKGERNAPAEKFVQKYFSQCLELPCNFNYEFPENLLEIEKKIN